MANYQVGIFDLKIPSGTGSFNTQSALQVIEAARRAFPRMIIVTISSVFLDETLRARLPYQIMVGRSSREIAWTGTVTP
jgi:hypothetical protein